MAIEIFEPMRFTIDLDTGLVTKPQRTQLNYGDVNANRIIVRVIKNKQGADLSGVSATGSFYRPGDRAQIALNGEVSGSEASVTLIDHCYAVEGEYEAEVKLTYGGVTRTILSITGYVHRAGSGELVDVAGVVPNIKELLAQIQATKDAAASANTAAGNANAATTNANNAANAANSAASNANTKAQAAQTAADAANAAAQDWSNGTAANANKLNGKDASKYALKTDLPTKASDVGALAEDAQAADSAKLGGIAASEYAKKTDIPGDNGVDLLTVYPVGCVYKSFEPTSPAVLFGGTWEQIVDRFLLGAGNMYAAGSAGGEAAVALTEEGQNAPHSHVLVDTVKQTVIPMGKDGQYDDSAYAGMGTRIAPLSETSYSLSYSGGGLPHNNMPPYLAVYIWRRVA